MYQNKKRVLQTNKKTSQNQTQSQKFHQKNKHLSTKILRTILKMDKRRTQTNGKQES